jgi:hypothetical protein
MQCIVTCATGMYSWMCLIILRYKFVIFGTHRVTSLTHIYISKDLMICSHFLKPKGGNTHEHLGWTVLDGVCTEHR